MNSWASAAILVKNCIILLLLDKELSLSDILFQKYSNFAGLNYGIVGHVECILFHRVFFLDLYFSRLQTKTLKRHFLFIFKRVNLIPLVSEFINQNNFWVLSNIGLLECSWRRKFGSQKNECELMNKFAKMKWCYLLSLDFNGTVNINFHLMGDILAFLWILVSESDWNGFF